AAADRYRPSIAADGLPLDGEDRRAREIEPFWEVIVDEGLDEPVVVGAALFVAGQRPDVVDQYAIHPRIAVLEVQHDERRPDAPVLVPELGVAVGRDLHHGPDTPDQA